MLGVELFDGQSGEKLGKIDRVLATVRIEDLTRSTCVATSIQELKLKGSAWVSFENRPLYSS
jgi:hypothetical protein